MRLKLLVFVVWLTLIFSSRLLVAAVTAPIIDTNSVFCAGQQLKLKNAAYFQGKNITFYWKYNSAYFSNIMEPVIRNAGIYSVYADSAGFLSAVDTYTITFTKTLTPINLTVADTLKYCDGKTAPMISFNGYLPTDSIILFDDPALTLILNVYSKSPIGIDMAGAGIYDLYLVRKDTDGCQSPYKKVMFVKNPRPVISILASDTFNCKITSITLDASASKKDPSFNLNWSGPPFQSGGSTLTPVANLPGSYALTIINIKTGCNQTDSIRLKPFIPPAPGTPKANINVCDTGLFDLYQLMDNITPGGYWVDKNSSGRLNGNFFNASGAAAGAYTFIYRIDSINNICKGGESEGSFLLSHYKNPGKPLPANTCNTFDSYLLSNTLTGYDTGGVWTSKYHASLIAGDSFLVKNLPEANYSFTYRFAPPSECRSDSTNVVIGVFQMKNLGTAVTQTICSTDSINLFNAVVGAERGGVWQDPQSTGNLHDSIFFAAGINGGVYSFNYTFPDNICPLEPLLTQVITDTIPPVLKCKEAVNFSLSDFESDYLDVTSQSNIETILEISDNCGKYKLSNNLNNDSTLIGSRITENISTIIWTVVDSGRNSAQCVIKIKLIGIPNIFTPNGDAFNETWDFSIENNYPNAKILIYDRWGNKVWESKEGYPEKWDGKGVPPATYRYLIMDGKETIFTGYVTLVR